MEDSWFAVDPDVLICCVWKKIIKSTALIRTFRFYDSSCGVKLSKHAKLTSRYTSESIVIHAGHRQS